MSSIYFTLTPHHLDTHVPQHPFPTRRSPVQRPIVRAELNNLKSNARSAISRTSDRMSRYHLQDLVERIDLILDPK